MYIYTVIHYIYEFLLHDIRTVHLHAQSCTSSLILFLLLFFLSHLTSPFIYFFFSSIPCTYITNIAIKTMCWCGCDNVCVLIPAQHSWNQICFNKAEEAPQMYIYIYIYIYICEVWAVLTYYYILFLRDWVSEEL